MSVRLRLFLLVFLSGCASNPEAIRPPAPINEPTPAAPAPAAPQPAPPAPSTPAAQPGFEAWRADFIVRAVAQGWDRSFLERELGALTPNPQIVSLDRRQPEFSRPVGDYVRSALSADRITRGREYLASHPRLSEIERRFGVPAPVLIGIWAQESAFGRVQGDFDVIRSLATLAHDGRRREWAEAQLLDALRIVRSGAAARTQLKGSWAGAMGQTQFMPENYLKLAVDGDDDGRVDIWGSDVDALASAANLLSKAGWTPGQSWAVEVIAPSNFDFSLSDSEKQTPAWWEARGVRRADGRPWSVADAGAQATLLLPAGARGPAFLAFPNHYVIRRYNNSVAYALAVGLLGDRIGGGPDLVTPWPAETPLSRDQRVAAQTALAQLGFDPGAPDGVIGSGTRAALRQWQKSRGRLADGYLTAELVTALKAEAGLP
jgi:lytic murein transglycosylase